jgi:integrase
MATVTGHKRLVQRREGPVFYARIRTADGRQIQRRIGPKWTGGRGRPEAGYFTEKTAAVALAEMLAEARRGTLAGAEAASGKTFADAVAEWIRFCRDEKGITASTLRDYENTGRGQLIAEFGGQTPLVQITTKRIDAYRARLLTEGKLSRRSIQKYLVNLHGVFARAKRHGWIPANPCTDADRVSVKVSGDFNVLSPAEVAAVSRAAEDRQLAAAITVAAFTGLRLGELRALRWGDVDFTARMILVKRNLPSGGVERAPKSGKVRSVPLIDQAATALDGLSRRKMFTEPGDRVFCSATGDPLADVPIRRGFYTALSAADLGHLREQDEPMVWHDLRHTFGTLGAAIWPLHDLQGYMGHADIQTTMIYVHHVPKIEAADEMSRAVEAAMGAGVENGASNGASKLAYLD